MLEPETLKEFLEDLNYDWSVNPFNNPEFEIQCANVDGAPHYRCMSDGAMFLGGDFIEASFNWVLGLPVVRFRFDTVGTLHIYVDG